MTGQPKITLGHHRRGVPIMFVQFITKMGLPFFDHNLIKALTEHLGLERFKCILWHGEVHWIGLQIVIPLICKADKNCFSI